MTRKGHPARAILLLLVALSMTIYIFAIYQSYQKTWDAQQTLLEHGAVATASAKLVSHKAFKEWGLVFVNLQYTVDGKAYEQDLQIPLRTYRLPGEEDANGRHAVTLSYNPDDPTEIAFEGIIQNRSFSETSLIVTGVFLAVLSLASFVLIFVECAQGKKRVRRQTPNAYQEKVEIRSASGEEVVIRYAPGAKERLGDLDLDALLRDVAGIGAENKHEANDVWTRFDAMTPSQQKKALSHRFSIENRYSGMGWENPTVTLDGKILYYRVSYIGPGIGKFIDCVNNLEDGDDADFTWMDEPGAYSWHFNRRETLVYIEIPDADDGIYLPYAELRTKVNALKGHYGF